MVFQLLLLTLLGLTAIRAFPRDQKSQEISGKYSLAKSRFVKAFKGVIPCGDGQDIPVLAPYNIPFIPLILSDPPMTPSSICASWETIDLPSAWQAPMACGLWTPSKLFSWAEWTWTRETRYGIWPLATFSNRSSPKSTDTSSQTLTSHTATKIWPI